MIQYRNAIAAWLFLTAVALGVFSTWGITLDQALGLCR
jgi:hypothetical protein